MLFWALERSGKAMDELEPRFPKLDQWLTGEVRPTLKQLESYAKAVYVPLGYLFLPEPPEETIPIPDLRTMGSRGVAQVSPNMLDTIYLCQRRQAWYRDYCRTAGEDQCSFVGSVTLDRRVTDAVAVIRDELGFTMEARRSCRTWEDALRQFIRLAEAAGVLVMVNGVVGNNNTRKLDPNEFRGFALVDEYAPLVFINGKDTKAAQIFTLAHELAHLWLGESALSDVAPNTAPSHQIERWCNEVAAELLVPMDDFIANLPASDPLDALGKLARHYKVSSLVIIRRIYDAGRISYPVYQQAYEAELDRLLTINRGSGGRFYLTQEARASHRFVRALVASTLEGHTLYRDAFQLLGIKKAATFQEFGERLGIIT